MSLIGFTKVALPHGWMGNMSPHPVRYLNNTAYPSAEHLFQWLRFDRNDSQMQVEILKQTSPMAAKMVAKTNAARMVVEPCSTLDVFHMSLVVRLKVLQNKELQEQLLETDDAFIYENVSNRPKTGNHRFWGAEIGPEGVVEGQNILGRIWMQIRDELKGEYFHG